MHIYIYIDILMSNDVLRSSRLSSSGPLDDLPFLANQTVQPPVQPVQPGAKSLECHVLARDMTCSPDFCSCLFILGLWSSRRAFRLLLYRLWDLYIYIMRCFNPTATTYQMRSLEPCIADGSAPVKKAHVSLQWLIHENPNPCRAHPALGFANVIKC